jgi:FHA domain
MAEDLSDIDLSQLDALAKLEADQRAIRALSEKAAWHRDKVIEVYSRVLRDYEARMTVLDEQADEVRRRVRGDLGKLDTIHARCRAAVEQARVELQESEFRHEIGEFTREEFQTRQQAAERTIAERQAEFESVTKLRVRYLELLPGEAAPPAPVPAPMARPVAPAPAPPAVVAPAPAPVATPAAPAAAAPPPQVPAPPLPAAPAPPVPVSAVAAPGAPEDPIPPAEGATSFLPPPSSTDFQVPPAGEAPGDAESFGTIAVSAAMLIEDRSGLPGAHHRLGLLTSIGRTPDNQIVVPIREVSRRHAEIVLTEGGYMVKDLGSPNGTFVNGERISEHRLQDEDRIAMGGQVFVFKAR